MNTLTTIAPANGRQTPPALRVQRYQAATVAGAARALEQALAQHQESPARFYVTRAGGIWTVRAVSLL